MQVISKCDLNTGGQGSMWIFGESISDKTSPGLDHVPGVLERQPYSSQRLRRYPTWPKKFSVKLGSAVQGCNAHLVPSVAHCTVGAGITVQSYFSIPRQLKSVLTGGSFYRFPFFSQHTFLPLSYSTSLGRLSLPVHPHGCPHSLLLHEETQPSSGKSLRSKLGGWRSRHERDTVIHHTLIIAFLTAERLCPEPSSTGIGCSSRALYPRADIPPVMCLLWYVLFLQLFLLPT